MALHTKIVKHIDIQKMAEKLDTGEVLKVGWPKNIQYNTGEYVGGVAAQNEYGNPLQHIPARPFMAPAAIQNKDDWMKIIESGAKSVVMDKLTVTDLLHRLGRRVAKDIVKAIKNVTYPPLAERTIQARFDKLKSKSAKKKGITTSLTKPLIDTGIMWRSVDHVVEKENG